MKPAYTYAEMLIITILICLLALSLYAIDWRKDKGKATFDDLLDAIEFVESGGNADAIGDNGNAVGSFQIWKIYVDDVNRILKLQGIDRRFFYRARRSRSSSREMTIIYLKHYGGTFEEMARKHVAGPDGWRNDPEWFVRNRGYTLEKAQIKIANAKAYWAKVKARMENDHAN